MSKLSETVLNKLQFYTTAQYPCSYIPGQMARSEVAAPTHLIDTKTYSKLIKQGFRRSGLFTYRPSCDTCRACIPIRVDASQFKLNRTQRKLWHKMQANYISLVTPMYFDPSHYDLYSKYQHNRHTGLEMDTNDQDQYMEFLLSSRIDSAMVQFYDENLTIKIIAIIDYIDDGISAVYTFYDTDTSGSLGTYAILWQLEYCRQLNKPWLYLGYWVQENRKMSYKSQFSPHQILLDGKWQWSGT